MSIEQTTGSATDDAADEITRALLDRYGLTMDVPQLCEVLHMKQKSVQNAISAARFPIETFKATTKRLAYTAHVAAYLARQRGAA